MLSMMLSNLASFPPIANVFIISNHISPKKNKINKTEHERHKLNSFLTRKCVLFINRRLSLKES